MTGPLQGVRVVDFGQYIAGPLAAVMLADQGAEVIHVDPPGGPRLGGPPDAFLNRNKRRIILDLKQDRDLAVAARLIESADVVVENFRPGVMDRLGLGCAPMSDANPRLVYCSLPGFPAGTPCAGLRAWEGILHAATANATPRVGEEPPGWDWDRPSYSALTLPSNFGAYLGATSIVMALIARERTGRGQYVETPLYDAMFTLVGHSGTFQVARGHHRSEAVKPRGSGCYRCADGRHVQFDALNPRHLIWFTRVAGVEREWGPTLLDPTESGKPEVGAELRSRLTTLFATRTAAEWEAVGNAAGAAIGLVRTPQEWIETEQAQRTGAVTRLDDPEFGEMWMAGSPVELSRSVAGPTSARHLAGADTAEVLEELNSRQVPVVSPGLEPDLAHPLSGIKVVDLSVALSGPTCGRLLVEFGAEVTKISAPSDGVSGYLNRGKRSALVDLGSVAGQNIYWKLVDGSDVVIENMSPSTSDRLGIGYSEVESRRPDIVYTSISAYGRAGPWSQFRGWERQGQAVTGIMERTELPSVLGPYNPIDIGTGILATFATGLALFHKLVTGEGQLAAASLGQTGIYHQAVYAFSYPAYTPSEPRGYYAIGEGPLDRFYRASDRWLYLAARESERDRIGSVIGVDLTGLDHPELEAALTGRFAERRAEEWTAALVGEGIAAHVNVTVRELMVDPVACAWGLSVTQVVEDAGPCTMPGVSVRLDGTPAVLGSIPRRPGADAAAVLAEIGLADQLEALERAWVVRARDLPEAWPPDW